MSKDQLKAQIALLIEDAPNGYTPIKDVDICVEDEEKTYRVNGFIQKYDYLNDKEENGKDGEEENRIELTAQEWTEDSELVGKIYEY